MRSFLAILAGFLTITILGNILGQIMLHFGPSSFYQGDIFTTKGAVASLLCAQLCNVVGGYVTGRVAPRRPIFHAVILGLIGVVTTIWVAIALWKLEPLWYHFGTILLALPVIAAGGWLAQRQRPV